MKEKLKALAIFIGTVTLSVFASELFLRWRIDGDCGNSLFGCLSYWLILEESLQKEVLCIVGGGGLIGLFLVLLSFRKHIEVNSDVYGSARWATFSEVSDAGLLEGEGVFLGQLSDGSYLRHDGPEHCALIAPTRSGKGIGIITPTLLTWPHSTIVYDVKEENWRITAGKRAEFSRVIKFSPTSQYSHRYNPLAEVRLGINEVRDSQNIADMIVDTDGSETGKHWDESASAALVAAILHVLYVGEEQNKNIAGVARFLMRPGRSLGETLQEMMCTRHIRGADGSPLGTHPAIAEATQDLLTKGENDLKGVLSTLNRTLRHYRDPLMAANTEISDFRIMDLVEGERPVSLYLVIPPSDTARLKPLVRLLLNQICRRLTEELTPKPRPQRLLLMLDEFPTLGRLEFFESALGFLAGYGIKAMLVCQSLNQLRQAYGMQNSILDNCHVQVMFAPSTVDTAEYISRSLGSTTVGYRSQGESRTFGSFVKNSTSLSHQIASRPLLTPREVMDLSIRESLIFVGNQPPIRSEKICYYNDRNFLSCLIEPPAVQQSVKIGSDSSIWWDRLPNPRIGTEISDSIVENSDSIIISPVNEELANDLV